MQFIYCIKRLQAVAFLKQRNYYQSIITMIYNYACQLYGCCHAKSKPFLILKSLISYYNL